jgi:hypothetical protein
LVPGDKPANRKHQAAEKGPAAFQQLSHIPKKTVDIRLHNLCKEEKMH